VKVVPPGFLHGGEGPPHPPHPSGDRLEITMQQVPGLKPGSRPNTVLFLRNGYASKLRYTAVMSGAGRSASTDVCDVAPHLLGLEYWPYPIKELDLSSFQLVEWDNAIECK